MSGTPLDAAARGEEVYRRLFKTEYEAKYSGQFVAIDVKTERAFRDTTPEGALQKAQAAIPGGMFHLIRVGSPGVFRVGYTSDGNRGDWVFGKR